MPFFHICLIFFNYAKLVLFKFNYNTSTYFTYNLIFAVL